MRHVAAAASAAGGARFIDPKALARIETLELLAKTVVDGFINGLHRSPYLGLSLDFAEHRPYMPGDDVRRIDWRLFARTDRFHVKEYEAETNADLVVLLDVSGSMRYAGAGIPKFDYARYLAASLAYFSSRQRDRIGLVAFDRDIVEYVPASAKHLDVALHTLDRLKPGRPGALGPPLQKLAGLLRRRGILVLVSDLYEEPEAVVDALKPLRYKGNDIIVFHLLDRNELDFPFDEVTSFEDLESGERIPVTPAALRERYIGLVRAHTAQLARRLGDHGIDYTLVDTSTPLDTALFRYLSERQRLSRVR
ncbi:MAG TPA: DUF58 domain-containing protein [Longimicrobiales bacterium]|nr:DUF58 domain-containing protein [Longimicrobiales bacterium]